MTITSTPTPGQVVMPETLLALPGADEPTRVVALRGLPASGKSTAAKAAQNLHPGGSVVRINNDELADSLLGPGAGFSRETAVFLGETRERLLLSALGNPTVRLVIVDNTNLNTRTVEGLRMLAVAAGADFVVEDIFLTVSVEECIERDEARGLNGGASVGAAVIRKMAQQAATMPKLRPLPPKIKRYHNDPSLPGVWLVDVDGTLAIMNGRGPFDWHRVSEDHPNTAVVETVRALMASGKLVVVMSGRDGVCREDTQVWLDRHVAPGLPLHMRAPGDNRPDHVVKHELFNAHIADRFRVEGVLDDRDQVVDLWRRKLGLPTFQVADGNF